MSIEESASSGRCSPTVRLRRSDLVYTDQGTFLLPLTLEDSEEAVDGCLTLDVNEAARLHAQLTRHLTKGWALTEAEKASRQLGEIYPVGGGGRLMREET